MRAGEITHHSVAQQARHHRVLINQLLGRSAPKAHDDDVIDCFGRVDALVRVVDAEAVPAKAELGNMTPPIGEQLADPNRSRDHLVPAFRLVAFGMSDVRDADPITTGEAHREIPEAIAEWTPEHIVTTTLYNIQYPGPLIRL